MVLMVSDLGFGFPSKSSRNFELSVFYYAFKIEIQKEEFLTEIWLFFNPTYLPLSFAWIGNDTFFNLENDACGSYWKYISYQWTKQL